jgi:hypothetical protein
MLPSPAASLRRLWPAAFVSTTVAALALAPTAPAAPPDPATARSAAAVTSFSFGAGGDMGYSPDADATLKQMAASGLDFSLHFGDMAYDQIYPETAWCDFVKGDVGANFPYEIVTGGHDLGGAGAQYRASIDKYGTCLPDHMGSTGTYGKEYFFDHPAANPLMRVIMISPSITMPDGTLYDYSAGSPHYQWLVDAIDGARAAGIRWVVVGMARDCVTAGEKSCEIGADVFNLLVEKRVDLILQGHEHGYERSKQLASGPGCPAVPLNAPAPAACITDDGSDNAYTKGNGPVIVIAGTLGIGLRPMFPKDPEAPDFVTLMGQNLNDTKGFVEYTVSATQIQARFVRSFRGDFTDSFTITNAGGGEPAPPAPSSPPSAPAPAPQISASGAPRAGYWMLGAGGRVYPFGDAAGYGGVEATLPAGVSAVDIEPTPSQKGYWVLDGSGRVAAFGDAPPLAGPDLSGLRPGEQARSLSATPTGKGYWLFTSRGRVVPLGDAPFLGDVVDVSLAGPVLDSVATPTGKGYYMVASDGGVFAFGDARFDGSMGGRPLNAPVQSLVPDGDGSGYWLVASDGGVFAFDAPFRGSMGSVRLNRPVTGMVRYGDGYLMVASDGGIFDFSDRPFAGSLGARPPDRPVVSVAALD